MVELHACNPNYLGDGGRKIELSGQKWGKAGDRI
jgi:hypothetical protein